MSSCPWILPHSSQLKSQILGAQASSKRTARQRALLSYTTIPRSCCWITRRNQRSSHPHSRQQLQGLLCDFGKIDTRWRRTIKLGDGRTTCRLEDAAAAWLLGLRRDSPRICCSWRQSCSLCRSMVHEVLREKRVREALFLWRPVCPSVSLRKNTICQYISASHL